MYTFIFRYEDGNDYSVENITQVKCLASGRIKTISEDEILTYCFPIDNHTSFHLSSENGNYSFNNNQLRHIIIKKEN